MFLIMLIEAATIIGSIILTLMALSKGFKMSISTGGSSNMLGESSKEGKKAKELDKPPLNNPNTVGGNNQAPAAGAGGGYGQPSLPDMKGADYGSYGGDGDMSNLPDMASGLSGGGAASVVGVAGLVNFVGIGAQSGDIANFNVAAKQVIKGPIHQGGGMIYTDKLKTSKKVLQSASNSINNNIKGIRPTLTQNATARNAISASRASIVQRGAASSYISGPVNRIRNGRTENLRLRAPLKVQKLMVKKFTVNKATSNKMRQLASGVPAGQNQPMPMGMATPQIVGVNVNDIGLRRINTVKRTNVALKAQNDSTMIGIQNVFGDPKNAALSDPNKVKFYQVSRVTEQRGDTPVNNGIVDLAGFQEILRRTLTLAPNFSAAQAMQTATLAAMMANEKSKAKTERANRIAEEKTNPENMQREALDGIISDPSSQAGFRYQKMVEETMRETNSISEERMKEIEKEAWETTQARQDIPLEEKEAEYEKLKEEKIEAEGGVSKEDVEEIVKDRILKSPEFAQAIIGEDGAKKLEEVLNQSKEDKDKVVVQELIKQDVEEHKEFLKNNPQARKKSYYEAYKERHQQEMDKNITMAASQLYANKSRDFDKSKYQQMMPQGSNNGMAQNQAPQPTGASQIFIARGAQDRSSAGGV